MIQKQMVEINMGTMRSRKQIELEVEFNGAQLIGIRCPKYDYIEVSDDDGHDYIIPEALEKEFNVLIEELNDSYYGHKVGLTDELEIKFEEKFSKYKK